MLEYLRALLVTEEYALRALRKRTVSYPSLEQTISYRVGRVEAYREIIYLLAMEAEGR